MIKVNAVLTINNEEVVPVRAVPFVTGGDIGPRTLATMLADPEINFLAYVLGPNNAVSPMLPKSWRHYADQLSANGPDLYDRTALEILPACVFVYWTGLWRTHEDHFLPQRAQIPHYSKGEQDNFKLEPNVNIPNDLELLVFDGFRNVAIPSQGERPPGHPSPISTGNIAHSFADLKWSEEEWMKPLGDKPKWLDACVAIPGQRGARETQWNPIKIGAALIGRGDAKTNSVRARFQTMPHLKPWLPLWNEYEADNLPSH